MNGYKITVTQVSDELHDPDDRVANPAGTYFRIAETEDEALDDFHSSIPIGCLEDFEITIEENSEDEAIVAEEARSSKIYKVWIQVEEITEHEDGDCDYQDLDLDFAASQVFDNEKQAIEFAGNLHRIAEGLEPSNNDSLLYKTDASYCGDDGKGENPLGLRFEVHKAGDEGIYNEIAIDCYDADGDLVGNVYVGLCPDKKDMRILLTTDRSGNGDQAVAVYPMRDHHEAVNVNWN